MAQCHQYFQLYNIVHKKTLSCSAETIGAGMHVYTIEIHIRTCIHTWTGRWNDNIDSENVQYSNIHTCTCTYKKIQCLKY